MSRTTASGRPDWEQAAAEIRATLDRVIETQARIEERQREQAEEIRELASRLDQDRVAVRRDDREPDSASRKSQSWLDRLDEVPPGVDLFARWADDPFFTEWDILIETLLQGGLVRLLEERGMEVKWRSGKVTLGDQESLDLAAEVSTGIVGVRVREPLRLNEVRRFEKLMGELPDRAWMARGRSCYGAVACLEDEEDAAQYAAQRGMFVIRSTRKSLHMENGPDFRPRILGGPDTDGDGAPE